MLAAAAAQSPPVVGGSRIRSERWDNEALQALDLVVAGAIEEPPRASPPGSPALGGCYIVAADATDAWLGMSQSLAAWTSGGWRFTPPIEGMSLYERSSGTWMVFRSGAWESGMVRGSALVLGGEQVVGSRAAAIDSPTGGATVDAECRAALDAILGALREHGLIET
jgi:hypothetical protein